MFKYSILIAIVIVYACNPSSPSQTSVEAGSFIATHFHPETDRAAAFMMAPYQNLLVGLSKQDTSYMTSIATAFQHMNDSLAELPIQLDSTLHANWVVGLQNMNAELQGLVAVIAMNDPKEINMAVHMVGLQFIHLLGQIGYKQKSIYIFRSEDEHKEDGFTWIGVQKNAKDPFHPNQKAPVIALQLLQESK